MKALSIKFIIVIFALFCSGDYAEAQGIIVHKKSGASIQIPYTELDSISTYELNIPEEAGHEYVDMGLPSGTCWATCNLGADSPELLGDKYAWGEISPKDTYTSENYIYFDSYYKITKYCVNATEGYVDNKTELELQDDAAYMNWGGDWKMPTKTQWEELTNTSYTKSVSYTFEGNTGVLITSKANGNSIFIPGQKSESTKYWTSTLGWGSYGATKYNNYAYNYEMFSSGSTLKLDYMSSRSTGLYIRPVRKQ